MPYIGNTIRAADDYRLIDDISSGFDGNDTTFALQVAGSAPVPFPKSPQQVLISVNGVIQEPDPTGASGFNLVGTNIVFSSAPTNGQAFFGIIYATADYLNAGGTFPAGALGAPSITFTSDEDTGFYRKGSGDIGVVSNATEVANFDGDGLTIADSIIHAGDTDTKIRFSNTDEIKLETAGAQRLKIDATEIVFNDDGANTDFRIEGDTDANLINVDAGNDLVNIGSTTNFGKFGVFKTVASNAAINSANAHIGIGSGSGSGTICQAILYFAPLNGSGNRSPAAITTIASGNTASDLAFFVNANANFGQTPNTQAMRINSSGNVGINTSSPAAKLHVIGETRIDPASGESTLRFSVGGTEKGKIAVDSSSNLLLETANSERLRVDSSGRLLIGISSSQSTRTGTSSFSPSLQISSDSEAAAAITRYSNGVDSGRLSIQKARGTNASKAVVQNSDNLGQILFSGWDGDTFTNGAKIECEVDGTPGDDDMPGRLVFFTTADGSASATERMRIDSSGNVGIGVTPTDSFSFGQAVDIGSVQGGFYYARDTNAGSNAVGGIGYSGSGLFIGNEKSDGFIRFSTNTSATERMRIDSSGRVGIGTSSPGSYNGGFDNLVIRGSGNTGMTISTDDNSFGQIAFGNAEDTHVSGAIQYRNSDNILELRAGESNGAVIFSTVSNTERMRITSGGRVGINTTSPDHIFEVEDNNSSIAVSRTGANAQLLFKSNNVSTCGQIQVSESNGGGVMQLFTKTTGGTSTERMRIDESGRFYFATTSQGAHGGFYNIDGSASSTNALNVKGTTSNYVMVSSAGGGSGDHIFFGNYTSGSPSTNTGRIIDDGSNVTYHTTSDYRLKENVVTISDGISRVKQLNPIRHTWINNPTPGTVDGWLAHELDEVCPYAVDGEKDATNPDGSINPQGVDYGRITPLLTAALKEAIAKIEVLETKVEALEAA